MRHILFILLIIVGMVLSANAQVELIPGVTSGTPKELYMNQTYKFDTLTFRVYTYTDDANMVKGVTLRSYMLYTKGEKALYDELAKLKTHYTEKLGPPRWNRLSQWNIPYALKKNQTIRVTSWVTDELIVFIGVYGNDEMSNKIMIEVYDVAMLEP